MWGLGLYSVLWMFALTNAWAANLLYKCQLATMGVTHLLFSRDTKWDKKGDSAIVQDMEPLDTRRIVFVRHGESQWNEVFNKGFGPSFIVRLVKAIIAELLLLPYADDSVFFDSGLNTDGVKQASGLYQTLEKGYKGSDHEAEFKVLRGDAGKSILVSSNLRRCVATGAIAFWGRLWRHKEKIHVLSCLQEISRNVDTLALTPPKGVPTIAMPADVNGKGGPLDAQYLDGRHNEGNKPLFSNGGKRMAEFAEWAFTREEGTIIVSGHSLWFRSFFNAYLPKSFDHECKKVKIVNSGVIAFTLHRMRFSGRMLYYIPPDSILELYGGFERKSKTK
eukprot:EG_transcript_17694